MSQRNQARAPQLLRSCSRVQEAQLRSPRAATTEACALQQRNHCSEKHAHCNWRGAPAHHNLEKKPRSSEDPAQPERDK